MKAMKNIFSEPSQPSSVVRRCRSAVVALMTGIVAVSAATAWSQPYRNTRPRPISPQNTAPPAPQNRSTRTSQNQPPVTLNSEYEILPIPVRSLRDYAWHYIDVPLPRKIKVHDIISIIVDEKSEVTLRSGFNRQRTANLKAELKEFLRIGKRNRLSNAARNQPTIDANLTSRMQTNGRVTEQEGIRYRIAAIVVDVLPNGNLVIEGRKTLQSDHDVWTLSLTGIISSQNVRRDNTALSENIANLVVVKRRSGKVYDSTKRPWGIRLYDMLSPF